MLKAALEISRVDSNSPRRRSTKDHGPCAASSASSAKQPVAERLVDSLKRLEYRGYDSAGVAAVVDGKVERRRAQGKIKNLEAVLAEAAAGRQNGIGHVRWATHGAPNVANAHPHTAGRVTLVHNGIIENFAELKAELAAAGRTFESDTDTEVIAHLIDAELATGLAPLDAFKATLDRLTGAYALAVLIEGADDLILGARAAARWWSARARARCSWAPTPWPSARSPTG
jgi:glucosamine--fructose-6-phosphate aminotransferase (isomerizing)